MLRPAYRAPVLNDGWRHQLLWIFYYAQPQNLYVGQLWFLAALFWAELLAYIWVRLVGKRHFLVQWYNARDKGIVEKGEVLYETCDPHLR